METRVSSSGKLPTRLGRFPCGERLDIGRFQCLAADGPVSAFEFIDADPGDRAHVLALDLDHCRSNFGDQLLLLLWGKNVFNHIDGNERHVISPWGIVAAAGTIPPPAWS
jgi:hypothetical protein